MPEILYFVSCRTAVTLCHLWSKDFKTLNRKMFFVSLILLLPVLHCSRNKVSSGFYGKVFLKSGIYS